MVVCLERGADLHVAQLMPLPLTISCFSKIQIGFTFLVPAHLGSPGKGPLSGCMYVCDLTKLGVIHKTSVQRERGGYVQCGHGGGDIYAVVDVAQW